MNIKIQTRCKSELINSLSENNYLFVVGDDDQSIYGWRGLKLKIF